LKSGRGEQSVAWRAVLSWRDDRDGAAGKSDSYALRKADGKNAIFVLPEDEVRAGEIAREIVEGAQQE